MLFELGQYVLGKSDFTGAVVVRLRRQRLEFGFREYLRQQNGDILRRSLNKWFAGGLQTGLRLVGKVRKCPVYHLIGNA